MKRAVEALQAKQEKLERQVRKICTELEVGEPDAEAGSTIKTRPNSPSPLPPPSSPELPPSVAETEDVDFTDASDPWHEREEYEETSQTMM